MIQNFNKSLAFQKKSEVMKCVPKFSILLGNINILEITNLFGIFLKCLEISNLFEIFIKKLELWKNV